MICESEVGNLDWEEVGRIFVGKMGMRGMVSTTPFSIFKRLFFVGSIERVVWLQEQGRVLVKGGHSISLRRWPPVEIAVVLGKFR